ncbi:hypothetical protein ACFLSY_11045, partial [Bacteroidota bacterium]
MAKKKTNNCSLTQICNYVMCFDKLNNQLTTDNHKLIPRPHIPHHINSDPRTHTPNPRTQTFDLRYKNEDLRFRFSAWLVLIPDTQYQIQFFLFSIDYRLLLS